MDTGAGVLNRMDKALKIRVVSGVEDLGGSALVGLDLSCTTLGEDLGCSTTPLHLHFQALSSCILLYLNLPASSVSYLFKPFSILLR